MRTTLLALSFLIFSSIASALPKECSNGGDNAKSVSAPGQVVWKKVFLQTEPKVCSGDRQDCRFKKKSFLVTADNLEVVGMADDAELGISFACVLKDEKPMGWIPLEALCFPPFNRSNRSEPLKVPIEGQRTCLRERTMAEDSAFYAGTFRSENATLTLAHASTGITYKIELTDGKCKRKEEGTLKVESSTDLEGAKLINDKGLVVKLTDVDAVVHLPAAENCPAGDKEFFVDPGGTRISYDNQASSGCDLSSAGIQNKDKLVTFLYRFRDALKERRPASIVPFINLPLKTNLGKRKGVKTPEQLRRYYSQIFTEPVVKAVLSQRIGKLFCRDQGVMLGAGTVWIQEINGEPKVVTVNP